MVFKPLTQLSCRFAGHPLDIKKKILSLPHAAEFVSNPADFKSDSVTHYYVPLRVFNATEIPVTQGLMLSPSNIHEFGDAMSCFLMAWSCSAILVGRLYLALNEALLLQTVYSFHGRG